MRTERNLRHYVAITALHASLDYTNTTYTLCHQHLGLLFHKLCWKRTFLDPLFSCLQRINILLERCGFSPIYQEKTLVNQKLVSKATLYSLLIGILKVNGWNWGRQHILVVSPR